MIAGGMHVDVLCRGVEMKVNGQVPDGQACAWLADHYQVLAMRHYSWYATIRDLMLAGFCLLFCTVAQAQVVQLHVLILAEDGKEVDREQYAPGQPVILDIRRLKGGK